MQARRLSLPAVLTSLLLAPPIHAAEWTARTVSESPDGMRLLLHVEVPRPDRAEVLVDGLSFVRLRFETMRPEGSSGAPALPVATQFVALPPGGSASLRILDTKIEDLGDMALVPVPDAQIEASPKGLEWLRETVHYDPVRYVADGPRNEAARFGDAGTLRHQFVVPLEIRPLLYDPATRKARLVRSLDLEITLRAGQAHEPTGDAAAARLATSPSWERIYAGTLVNPRRAAVWRRAPRSVVQRGGPLKSGLLRPGLAGEEAWKLRVRQTGPTRVTGSVLRSAGFPDATTAAQLRVYLLRYAAARPLDPDVLEIPIQILDQNGNGVFDPEDSFLFYAEHPRDDTTSEDTLCRYTNQNIYWLSIATTGSPARMRVLPRLSGTTPGPAVFQQRLHFEKDLYLDKWVFGSNFELVDTCELYFWGDRAAAARVTVPVPGRAPGASLRVCVGTQEDHVRRPYRLYVRTGARDSVLLASNPGTSPPSESAPLRQLTCGDAQDSQIDPGNLRVIILPQTSNGRVPYLDDVELVYPAQYVASRDTIRCTNGGASGVLSFPISGFGSANLRAFEISNPKSPSTFDLAGAYASGTLTLTDSVPNGAEHVYLVVPDATIPSIAAELDRRDDILGELATAPIGTYDGVVIVHDSFADDATLQQWISWRQSQGHRLRVVRVSDVYDAFRGGLQHYEAIHRFTQLAYTNWGIEFVVLVGDGSEDPVDLLGDSGTCFIPSRVRYFQVTSSGGGENEYRNDLNDKYYAQVAGGPNDSFPDLLIGRLPVGNSAQIAALLQKTMRYETPDPQDDGRWRKRVLMYADDEWVTRQLPEGFRHIRQCDWFGFEFSTAAACETAEGAFPGDLHCVPFFLRRYSDLMGLPNGERPPLVPEHRPISYDSLCNRGAIGDGQPHPLFGAETDFYHGLNPGQVGSALIDSVGEGVGFFSLQSHMNRLVVGDEDVISSASTRPFGPPFHNDGKPFVVFGFGCHMNEFGVPSEEGGNFAGDCLGEELIHVPSRGAVASYASTGYEFLGPNETFNEGMWKVIFEKRFELAIGGRPVDSDTIAARWLLSELVTIAEMQHADLWMRARYILLGDPMLRLDAGVPRVSVDSLENAFLQADNRLVIRDPSLPIRMQLTLRDEQGIDSLWVVKRIQGGGEVNVDSVTITAAADPAPQIVHKRAYTVSFRLDVDTCNFDIVVGARDLAGRRTEFVGRILFDSELLANGIPIQTGERVDPRTAFRFIVHGCTPIAPPLPLEIEVDGAMLPPDQVTLDPDSAFANWNADFVLQLANGTHALRFIYAGKELARYQVEVGTFGMSEILAFPNPLRKKNDVMRIYFHLGEPIAGGHLRVVDLNGRTVLKEDLAVPGVVRSDVAVPPGSIGSGVGQDDTHWNYVEIFRGGRDEEGDEIANGVYIYELYINGLSGQAQRKRDKIVIMR